MARMNVDIVENVVRGLLRGGISPRELFSGIHNAFAHGEILEEIGVEISDKHLEEFFEHIDKIGKIMKKLQE
jgi:hypothetical protein